MMLKSLCLFVLVTFVVHCNAKKCCLPQSWQVRQQTISAQSSDKSRGLQMFTEDMYYDSVGKRIRQDFYAPNVTLTVLQLFNVHVAFRILNNKSCTLFEPGTFPPGPICIPESWKKVNQYRLGFKPSINVAEYGHMDKVSTYVSMEDNCTPVSVTSFELPKSGMLLLTAALFENYLPDIPDHSVFHVPPICKHAMKEQGLVYEPLHEKMFWREMFAGTDF